MPPTTASIDTPLPTVRRNVATARRSAGPIALAFLRQLVYEHLVLGRRGVRFRSRDADAVRAAYSAMSADELMAGFDVCRRAQLRARPVLAVLLPPPSPGSRTPAVVRSQCG